jgi:hypothetical protein
MGVFLKISVLKTDEKEVKKEILQWLKASALNPSFTV